MEGCVDVATDSRVVADGEVNCSGRLLVQQDGADEFADTDVCADSQFREIVRIPANGFCGGFDLLANRVVEAFVDPGDARPGGRFDELEVVAKCVRILGVADLRPARKLQEVLLVFLMEHAAVIPKHRIIEVYLNVVEFGPEIYGIYDAARHYFDCTPAELTPRQAAWLASVLPNPRRYHTYYERGELTPTWSAQLDHILEVMRKRERISKKQYQKALENTVQFNKD